MNAYFFHHGLEEARELEHDCSETLVDPASRTSARILELFTPRFDATMPRRSLFVLESLSGETSCRDGLSRCNLVIVEIHLLNSVCDHNNDADEVGIWFWDKENYV